MEIFQQNFLDALPNKRTPNLKNFKPINIRIQKGCEEKETYQDNNGVIWVINFTPPGIENYIISGLYKLILGKYTPNEQLIRKNKKTVLLGSEFIADFVSFSRFLKTTNGHRCRKIGKTCLTNRNCFNSPLKNMGLTIATMMLLGESDAHCHNIGAICDKEKKSCGLAKVDHDYTSLLKTKEIKTRTLKKLSEELLYKSKVKNGMYDGALQNSYDIAYAMEIISSIPNDLWKKIVTERINTYISETGILLSNSKIKKWWKSICR